MLPELKYDQNVFVEITNPIHGGPGWELGTTLWSPVYSKAGNVKSWLIMEKVKPDDIVIHLVKYENQYHWSGISFISSNLTVVEDEPPIPTDWADMSPYQRISLESYTILDEIQPITGFFDRYEEELKDNYDGHSFYIRYGANDELRVAQRYFASCPTWLYELFDDFALEIGFVPIIQNPQVHVPTINEPSHPDYSAPGTIETYITRKIRDTKLSRELKEEFGWKCQICGLQIKLSNNRFYAEGHHIKPLGGDHEGPDVRENIIILCPNHHAEFDYGVIAIDPVSNTIIHIDEDNPYHQADLSYQRQDILDEFIRYHYEELFNLQDK